MNKLLSGRIELRPANEDGPRDRCEVTIPLTFRGLLTGVLCPQGMASPICASWNQMAGWLRAVDGLRRAA